MSAKFRIATRRKAPFAATFSYSYVRASEPGAGREDVPLTPRHSLGLVGMWEKEGKARFGVECYHRASSDWKTIPIETFQAVHTSK